MEIIKEKLIGTYVFSIDEATVKGDYQGTIGFLSTPEGNIGDDSYTLLFDRSVIELLYEYDYNEPAFANEYGEYVFKTPVKIGNIHTGETDKGIPFVKFLDENGAVIFRIMFCFSFTNEDESTYCVDFSLHLRKVLQNQFYDIRDDVITNDPTHKLKYIRCKDCGKPFALTRNEIEWFEKKHLSLPKRCEDCIELRKRA